MNSKNLGDGPISKFMHGKANDQIELITKFTYLLHCELFIVLGTMSALAQTVVNYYIRGLGDDAFYLPALLVYVCETLENIHHFISESFCKCIYRFPFDWRTPLGYVFAIIFVIIAGACTQIFISLILCFHVGFCWLIISFVKDITTDLNVLTNQGGQSRKQLIKKFYEIMDLYSNVKQLSRDLTRLKHFGRAIIP